MRYLILILTLAINACTLTTAAPITPEPVPVVDSDGPIPVDSDDPLPAGEEADDPGSDAPGNGSQAPAAPNNPACSPHTDWAYTYVVASGDTLSSIAQRASTSAAALSTGNCLTDANVIAVGQVLRSPNPVKAVLPAPSQPQSGQQGSVFISSYISADAGSYLLLRGDTVSLRWDNAPANLQRATFVLQSFTGSQTPVAEDTAPSNGITATWAVPGGVQGSLMVIGHYANSSATTRSFPAGVSSAPPVGQGCELTAASGTTLSAYQQPDTHSGIFLTAAAGQYFETLGRSLNGWFAIDAPGIPDVPYGVNRLKWIAPGDNLRGRGACPADVQPDNDGGSGGVETYTNANIGFALDYPAGWYWAGDSVAYVDFVAPDGRAFEINFGNPESLRSIEEEVASCKSANLCIGNRKILLEQPVTLPDGLSAIRLELSADLTKPDTTPAVYVFTIINSRNLVFRGFGSNTTPAFFDSILNSLRLLRF